ncbi:thiol:disulfide interchange protein DsbA/DsbL [Thiomonas sp. FB-6]|uniref:thiol:disulfide interchange protein DsbA/DsbL n=1 Tax=Thiomonas sp. FB-6 TaxID=1158291 RepID=UPI00037E5F81|nr:thiol:disulfide interchange protein DsbA/DsbL [Thiomonas sp. FB-6]
MMRWWMRVAAAALLGFTAGAQAAPAQLQPGQGYERLATPQPVSPKGKIVVTEFFWYNCPHCAAMEPLLDAWAKKLPPDVVLERVPVAFAPQFENQQKLYYALKALGKVDQLQGPIFTAIHQQHIVLMNPQQMANWLAAHGVPRQSFLGAFDSFGVQMEAKRATQMVTDYQIAGVPTLVVQGTYALSASMPQTPDNPQVLQGVDQMIAKVRADMKH